MVESSLAEAIWASAPDAMLVVDHHGVIARVNPAALELFGYGEGELSGLTIEALVPTRYSDGHAEKRAAYREQPTRRMMGAPLSSLVARHRDGSEMAVEVALSPLVVEGQRFTIAVVRDVRERQKLERELRYHSTHDSLTGLYNRAFLDQELERLKRGRRFPVAVIVIDIDGLKLVNDLGGHAAGDDLLQRAAKAFSSAARGDDVVSRVGGDEFVQLLPQATQEVADDVLLRVARAVDASNARTAGAPVRYSAGVGVAEDPAGLGPALRTADDRMYVHKRSRHAVRS